MQNAGVSSPESTVDQYFVVAADGTDTGLPSCRVSTDWVREGRILAQTLIRKNTDAPIAAASLPELAALFATPPAPGSSARRSPRPSPCRASSGPWEFIGKAWNWSLHWLPLSAMALIAAVIASVPGAMFIIGGAMAVVDQPRDLSAAPASKTPTLG